MIEESEEKCPNCGKVLKGSKFYTTKDDWVCSHCARDVESYG